MHVISRNGEWLCAAIDGQLLMMNTDNEDYMGLNEVGAFIWGILETPCTADDIVAAIVDQFDATPEQVRADLDMFLDELAQRNLISREQAQA